MAVHDGVDAIPEGRRRPGRDYASEVEVCEDGDQPPRRQRCRQRAGRREPGEGGACEVLAPQTEREQREDDGEDQRGDEVRDRQPRQ